MRLMEHQLKAVKEINEAYNNGNQTVIYTSGVGTGKSYVFMGLTKYIEGKILYVIPKLSIISNVTEYDEYKELMLGSRVDFCTLQYFNSASKSNKLNDYSLIVVDECHHLGSTIYGNNLLNAIKVTNSKVLGLTATPLREDKVDIRNLFGYKVQGLTNFEAIMQGLMPAIEYLVCSPDIKDIESDKRICIDWKNSNQLLRETIAENPKDKWICFFSNIKELDRLKPMIKELFPEHEILEIHSRKRECNKILSYANSIQKCVMLNCDMLLEGLHFSGVNGIILFRNVHSVPTFEQIIGRVSSMGKKENPLIIDTTDTWKRMDNYIAAPDEHEKRDYNGYLISKPKKPCFVSLKNKKYYDYMNLLKRKFEQNNPVTYKGVSYKSETELCRALNINPQTFNSRKIRNPNMNLEEIIDAILNKDYFYFRDKRYISFSQACRDYNLNPANVKRCYQTHNCTKQEAIEKYINNEVTKQTKWSDVEKEIINKYYPTEGLSISKRLPNRTKLQIKAYAQKNKIKCNNISTLWTKKELDFLVENQYKLSAKQIADKLNRTESAVRYQYRQLKNKAI